MNEDDSPMKDYFTVSSLDELTYDETTKYAKFPINEIVDKAFKKLEDCLSPGDREIFFAKRKPSSIVRSRLSSFTLLTYELLSKHRSFFVDNLTPIFWLTHLQINRPNQTSDIRELRAVVGSAWGRFLFPFETDSSINTTVRDSFTNSIPYFFTQCVQHLFILILNGGTPSTLQTFRMELCANLVKTFTQVEPLESLLSISLSFYFRSSPEYVINSTDQPEKQKFVEPPSSLLPEEDLTTLIEMPRRKRPRSTSWNAAGISSLISESTHRTAVPYEHNSKIVIQYPRDGEKDWTTDLPPLLPVPSSTSSTRCTKEDYNPNKETRSLLYRSRRPEILFDYNKMKKDFAEKIVQKNIEINDKKIEFQQLQKKIMGKPLIVLKKFTDDLRTFQLERKWGETPELHKRKELERMEEERKKKLEKERREEEEERRLKRIQRRKEKEEEQDKRDQERRKNQMKAEENKQQQQQQEQQQQQQKQQTKNEKPRVTFQIKS